MAQTVSDEVGLLAGMRLFASVSEADLHGLASHLRYHSYRKGEVIFHQDDPPGSLFFLKSGVVKIQLTSADGKRLTIAWVRPGNFFGTISSVNDRPRPETAIALEASEALLLQREVFQAFLKEHPESAMVMVELLAGRWQSALDLLQNVAFMDVPGRLAKVLLDFPGRVLAGDDPDYMGAPSQAELASLIGTTRESVNKWLQNFAHQGLIECQGKKIRILNAEGLRQRLE
jgi:CRP/FNR family transcriptional regulator/CRP/FNR family cyclic AMP-dependent transcriptional regulator